MAIALVIGVTIGVSAGYFGGWVDQFLSRIIDTLMAFPTIALLVTLSALVGGSLLTVIIVIGTTVWASYARVTRADTLSLREREYVQAARAIGVSNSRIIRRHVLPNILGPIIVLASLGYRLDHHSRVCPFLSGTRHFTAYCIMGWHAVRRTRVLENVPAHRHRPGNRDFADRPRLQSGRRRPAGCPRSEATVLGSRAGTDRSSERRCPFDGVSRSRVYCAALPTGQA